MLATPTIERGTMPMFGSQMATAQRTSKYHSLDEFADKLAKKLGQHYGMNDIRELLQ